MAPSWQNPDYERMQRRRRSLAVIAILALIAIALAVLPRARQREPEKAPALAIAGKPSRLSTASTQPPVYAASPEATAAEASDDEEDEFPPALAGGWTMDDFAARKKQALSLYRQNDLPGAQKQAQAALAMQRDDELIDLLMRVDREIRVQRDYDNARTANFTVLFDGYEHDELKVTVLGILKDAFADVGKELDHFPAEPVTVILYTSKDFSDVTRAPEWAGGMFGKIDGKIRVPVQGAEGQERTLRRVLYHEYVHAALHSLAPACPLWLHEGLAQYLSGERGVSVGQVIPLPMLAGGFPGDPRAAHAAYMESLQAVSDLVDERGMPVMRRLLNELGSGKGIEEAFAAAYGEPFSRWAFSWRTAEPGAAGEAKGNGE